MTAKNRRAKLRKDYGMTVADYDAMLMAQGGGCDICGATESLVTTIPTLGPRNGLHIDHDHACCPGPRSCGKCIRGILCSKCNRALGCIDDNAERAHKLADYLDRFAARLALTA
jgi:hypothetical protein